MDIAEIEIDVQETPNPKALKFILNKTVRVGGKVTFKNSGEAASVTLARDLFAIPGVTQVHFFENTISVSQTGEFEWPDIGPKIESVIYTRMTSHDPNFELENKNVKVKKELSPELQKIDEILERTVRPGLQADGGDIDLISLEDNVLTVNFQGACGGCPSSTMGTLYAIEGILQQEYDPMIVVRPSMEGY